MICVAINLSNEVLGQLFFDALLKRVGDETPKSQFAAGVNVWLYHFWK